MLNNIRLLKEAQKNPKDEIKEPNVTKEIGEAIKKVADLKQEIEDLRSGKGKLM